MKTFTKLYYRYKDTVYKNNSTFRDLLKMEINKAKKKLKSDSSKLSKSLNNLIRKDNGLPAIYSSLFEVGLLY